MRTRIACVVLLAVLQPMGARAQVSMTEQEAVARLRGGAYVMAAEAPIEVARAEALAAARWPNPRASFTREAAGGIAEQFLTASQVLPLTGRRALDMSAASARVEAATRRSDERIARLHADIRLAFTDLWEAQVRERELQQSRDRLQSLATVLEQREAAGEAAGFDHLRAAREVMEVDVDRASAAAERTRAEAILNGYFATPVDRIEAVPVPPSRTAVPEMDALVTSALAQRPGFMAMQRELDAQAFAEQAALRRRIPEPEVVGGVKGSDAGTGHLGAILGVHVTVPLFDRAKPELAAAVARTGVVRADVLLFRQQLHTEIAVWRAAVIERREIADRYRASVGASVEQIERIAQVSYDAGERGILELLDSYRMTASARVRQATLDAAVRAAEIELEFVSGWESR